MLCTFYLDVGASMSVFWVSVIWGMPFPFVTHCFALRGCVVLLSWMGPWDVAAQLQIKTYQTRIHVHKHARFKTHNIKQACQCTRTPASTHATSNKHACAHARSLQLPQHQTRIHLHGRARFNTWHPTKMAWHARMNSLALSCFAGCRRHECITRPVDVKHVKPARRGSWAHVPAAFASSKLGPQILPPGPQARTSSSGR